MRLIRHPRQAGQGARDPHHLRPAQRARELARLRLLERRARRRVRERRATGNLIGSASLGGARRVGRRRRRPSAARRRRAAARARRSARRARRRRRRTSSLRVVVPPDAEGGTTAIRIDELPGETAYIEVARVLATGVHQVDSPGVRSARASLRDAQRRPRTPRCRCRCIASSRDGAREPLPVEIANPTSLARGPDGALYVSSRFDGHVYRIGHDDQRRVLRHRARRADRAGVRRRRRRCSSAIDRDRSCACRQIGRSRRSPRCRRASRRFIWRSGPDDCLYVTAPTLATHDAIYRITPDRLVDVVADGFGRPQGLAFDSTGTLYVVDALAGAAGPLPGGSSRAPGRSPSWCCSRPALVGVAFDPAGGVVLASNDTRLAARGVTAEAVRQLDLTLILLSRMSVFRVKPLDQILQRRRGTGEHSLKRVLGAGDLIMLAIGAVIGAGIFGVDRHGGGGPGRSERRGRSATAPVRRWCCRSCCWAPCARSRRSATRSWRR